MSPITIPITTPASSASAPHSGRLVSALSGRVSAKMITKQIAAKTARQALTVIAPSRTDSPRSTIFVVAQTTAAASPASSPTRPTPTMNEE
ncbi:MAG: hypothetical protein U0232_27610 [Thermomicrobiales bacterium]